MILQETCQLTLMKHYLTIGGAFKKYAEFSRDKSASKKKRILAC